MILSPHNITPPPALTWTHLFPSSATFNCPGRPDWFRQRPAGPPGEASPCVEVIWGDAAAALQHAKQSAGIAAFNCRSFPAAALRSAGHAYVRHFAILPSLKNARWFIPLDSPAVSSAAMSMYTPSRLSARFKRGALRLAMHARMPFWYRDHIWIAQRQAPPIEQAINPLFPATTCAGVASSRRARRRANRKASGVVLEANGRMLAFVKMARSPIARKILEHETVVLKHLGGLSGLSEVAPQLLFSEEVDGVGVLAQTPLEGSPAPVAMTPAHREFLTAMQTPLSVRASDTATAADLIERFRALPVSRPDLVNICQSVLPILHEFEVPLTIVHGDFAPWNLRLHKERIGAFDWEYGEPHGLPLIDEMHYRLQTGWLLDHWTPRHAVAWLQQLSWERPLGLDPRHVEAISAVYLLDALARLLSEGYDETEEIISWHRQVLERIMPAQRAAKGGSRRMSRSAPTSVFRVSSASQVNADARADRTGAPPAPATARVVVATINPAVGDTGVQTHTRTLHDGLIASGVACDVVTPFARRTLWLPVFAARKLLSPFNPSWSTRWYRHWHAVALRQALVQQRAPSVVLAQCPVSAAAALDVRKRLGLDYRIAMVCHFNFSEATEYRDKGELANERAYQAILGFESRVLGSVDRVIYVSAWARRIVEQERGISVRASSVIWNGIAAGQPAAVGRSELGLNNGDLVLMNVGTLEKRKNQLGLIDLFAAIAERRPEARLVLVGDGPQRAEIRRRIDELNLAAKIRMLGMRHDVPALLATADLYVHYSAMENCPVVLLEAARAALPIAAAPGGGVPELLKILGGASLQPDNIAGSLDALQRLLESASVRHTAGEELRTAFEQNFTREAMIAAYLEAMEIHSSGNPRLNGADGCRQEATA